MTDQNQMITTEKEAGLMKTGDIKIMVDHVRDVMQNCMQKDRHYGVIPGTGSKPTLLKGGAELLCVMFRLRPEYIHERDQEGDHMTVHAKCVLFHIPSGRKVGEGNAICSTLESKYAYRNAGRKCPQCGKEAIYKSKAEFGGGFYCNKKAGGCGTSWKKDDPICKELEAQPSGKVPNEDLPDTWNTVLKMADKRALIAATLGATAASEVFTQDLEDMQENLRAGDPRPIAVDPVPSSDDALMTPEPADEIETAEGEVLQVRKMQEKDKAGKLIPRAFFYEIALTGGLVLISRDDAVGLLAKSLKNKNVIIEYSSRKNEVSKISAIPADMLSPDDVFPEGK